LFVDPMANKHLQRNNLVKQLRNSILDLFIVSSND